MNRELDIYLNINNNRVVLGQYTNFDEEFKQLTAVELLEVIDNLELWDDVDQEIYEELFREYNIDLDEWKDENGFYDVDDVMGEVKELVYS